VVEVLGELTLEQFRFRPGRKPSALERINDLVDFLSANAGFVEWNFHEKSRNQKAESSQGKARIISVFSNFYCLLFPLVSSAPMLGL